MNLVQIPVKQGQCTCLPFMNMNDVRLSSCNLHPFKASTAKKQVGL
uniref:Uncharacterized protein MANES_02G082800 n=1 Tax=Rhizophora mucronata TaxID=61149 RepID=A0A2P2LH41_RHIMU